MHDEFNKSKYNCFIMNMNSGGDAQPTHFGATAGRREAFVQPIHQTTRCGECFAEFVVEMPGET